MSFMKSLEHAQKENNSLVCVGLDPDLKKIPEHLQKVNQPILEFNKAIIDNTADLVCAYKPQIAYYSAYNAEEQLLATINYIHANYPKIPVILDAKRGDIGSTAEMYAKEAFLRYQVDAVTVNPFLGGDTIEPFLSYKEKGVIVLCRTSNPGARDLQDLEINGKKLYQYLAELASTKWNKNGNILLVVGATYPRKLAEIRALVGDMTLLVPGIGAQGGDIQAAVTNGKNSKQAGMIINSSRGILYASSKDDFAQAARTATLELRGEINRWR